MYEVNSIKIGDMAATCEDCRKRFKMSLNPDAEGTHERLLAFYTFKVDDIVEPAQPPTEEEIKQSAREFMSVSNRQGYLMLDAENIYQDVINYLVYLDSLPAADGTALKQFEKAGTYDRLNLLVVQVFAGIGNKTPDELDLMFRMGCLL